MNTNSFVNSGRGGNRVSNEGSARDTRPTYRLPFLDLDTSKTSGPLAQSLICPITHDVFKDLILGSDGNTYERVAINNCLKTSKKSPLTNEVLDNNILKSNVAVCQMLTSLAESTPPEVETVCPEKVINIDIDLGTTFEGHALRHESNNLSAGHASRHELSLLSPGHPSQQESIRPDAETVTDGHASKYTPRRPRILSDILKKKKKE